MQFADPAPKNETPQQKVKRLREAANRAKMAQVTKWDYAYLYGRMAADAAHRFTVYGLIFATGTHTSFQTSNCCSADVYSIPVTVANIP